MFYQLLVCLPLGKRDVDRYIGLLRGRVQAVNGTIHWDSNAVNVDTFRVECQRSSDSSVRASVGSPSRKSQRLSLPRRQAVPRAAPNATVIASSSSSIKASSKMTQTAASKAAQAKKTSVTVSKPAVKPIQAPSAPDHLVKHFDLDMPETCWMLYQLLVFSPLGK